ncbi:MAG: type IV secretory system conjugative DNA transfer family protein [Patescibacteria group bacterium]|nr:type IV secretory system conjugative DNA transfer family protein [Patescibacteria group bacterium]
MDDILYLGKTNFRNQERVFGIKLADRRQHTYVIGKSGTGKSTLLLNMVIADVRAGHGVCFVDPHGETAEEILHFIPEDRADDVIFINPADIDFPIAFNPLERVSFEMRHLVASGLMSVFKKIWPDAWSARMEYILNNTLLALLEYPNSTLLGIMKMFSDKEFRRKIVNDLQDPIVKSFWIDEFAKYTQRLETEGVAAIQNKIGQFVANPLIRNIIGQVHSSFDFRKAMDEGKIIIVNLSKGKIGEDNSNLLGAMLITKLQLAAMSRVDIPMGQRKDFFLYVDEFQNFATESFATILSEARKYRLSLIVAHQYIDQLDEKVRSAIFGNVGTMIVFRVGADDAEFLEKEFFEEFLSSDFVNLPNAHIYARIMVDGISSRPFSARTLPPPPLPQPSLFDIILQSSREKYSLAKEKVDEKIRSDYYAVQEKAQEMISRRDERSLGETLRRETHQHTERVKNDQQPREKKPPVEQRLNVDALKDLIRTSLQKPGEEKKEDK